MTATKTNLREAILGELMDGEWVTTGHLALRLDMSTWGVRSSLEAMRRAGIIRCKRRASDRQVLWCSADHQFTQRLGCTVTSRTGPDSKRQKIIRVLEQCGKGGALTGDIAEQVGIGYKLASAHLSNLRELGMVVSKRFDAAPGQHRTNRNLWLIAA